MRLPDGWPGYGLLADAVHEADKFLVAVIDAELARLEADGSLDGLVSDAEKASVGVIEVGLNSDTEFSSSLLELATDIADVDRLFKGASRKFRDGLADVYWGHRVTDHGDDSYDAKVLAMAMSWDPSVPERVETEAEGRVHKWFTTYGDAISMLSADKKAKYAGVRAMAKQPEQVNPTLPSVITMSNADDVPAYSGHLFADGKGNFKTKLRGWEDHVLKVEQQRPGFVGWYRNPTGGERALRIPFERADGFGKMYPDFLFFHKGGSGEIEASIVDPHGHHFGDAAPKLRGLAGYAEAHGAEYARVLAVIKAGESFLFLDAADDTVRAALESVNTQEEIEAVFVSHGAKYG